MTLYTYRATCISSYDGDTIEALVDLGFGTSRTETFRLAALDTDEMNSADPVKHINALAARDRVRALLPPGAEFVLTSEKDTKGRNRREKWRRYLARVTLADGRDLGGVLIAEGLARAYSGGAR